LHNPRKSSYPESKTKIRMVCALLTVNCLCASSWWMIPPDPCVDVWFVYLHDDNIKLENTRLDTGFKSCTLI